MEMGGPAGSPRNPVQPDQACRVNSVAGRSANGPLQPKSEMVTTTVRGLPQQQPRVDAQRGGAGPSRGHDDDVGAGEFGAVLIRIRRHAQAALAGVEVAVERTGHTVRYRRAGGRVLPQRISLRRFDFADLRTRIHQQLPAIAAGQAVTDLDDSQSVERRRPVIGLVTHAAIYTITAKIAKPMEFAGQRPCALSCCRLRGLG